MEFVSGALVHAHVRSTKKTPEHSHFKIHLLSWHGQKTECLGIVMIFMYALNTFYFNKTFLKPCSTILHFKKHKLNVAALSNNNTRTSKIASTGFSYAISSPG